MFIKQKKKLATTYKFKSYERIIYSQKQKKIKCIW